jgi:predicted ArsR family transcriptional regulator
MDDAGAALSPTQRLVLETLKRRGEATADELASSLGISASAVRQHLAGLRTAGFVVSERERGRAGRPADRYHATAVTEALFVASGSDLAIELLGDIEEESPELVDRIFQRRRRRLVEAAADDLTGGSLGQRVEALTGLLDAQGFLADFEQLDECHCRINLHSCPIWTVANRYRQACAAELGFIRDLIPDAEVERVTHKTAGAHTCTYEFSTRA